MAFWAAPVALPPAILPENSPVSQPNHHGSFPPSVHKRTENKGHTHTPAPVPPRMLYGLIKSSLRIQLYGSKLPIFHWSTDSFASPPWKMEKNQPVGHPILPIITPSVLPGKSYYLNLMKEERKVEHLLSSEWSLVFA